MGVATLVNGSVGNEEDVELNEGFAVNAARRGIGDGDTNVTINGGVERFCFVGNKQSAYNVNGYANGSCSRI